ncbi:integration host factor subunit alpha [Mariprofundus sp. EBB-1]|uniref:integration host factor subunit alpha n=1 Tax=Mariprofundus sp. EBB-1 TaxID=2650971 RepID=UPI000EF24EC6|nr:integration host factor subunit alpha [Mariprofundus sp. EBB-1]RLL53269.1 integration host factor subunit alpha [Mariprofundus sp. EBB-1]
MTKSEIAKIVHERVGLTKKESAQIVESVLSVVRNSLEKGENVKLSGFGHFIVRQKHARRGRNPKTGSDITIASRSVVTFRASPLLKQKLIGAHE